MALKRNLNDYIAGFVDGEGCFSLTYRKDVRHERPGAPTYYHWRAMFAIELRKDDVEILQLIKDTFQCGSITYSQKGAARYQAAHLDDLRNKIIPFFEASPLLGKKRLDFGLWKEAVNILNNNKINKTGDISRLTEIHTAMRPYKGIYANKTVRGVESRPLGLLGA